MEQLGTQTSRTTALLCMTLGKLLNLSDPWFLLL